MLFLPFLSFISSLIFTLSLSVKENEWGNDRRRKERTIPKTSNFYCRILMNKNPGSCNPCESAVWIMAASKPRVCESAIHTSWPFLPNRLAIEWTGRRKGAQGLTVRPFGSSYERILMAPPCRLIVYQTIDERDDMSGRNPFIVSCRNVMPRQPNRWITDSFWVIG